jgi:hypothetical protein
VRDISSALRDKLEEASTGRAVLYIGRGAMVDNRGPIGPQATGGVGATVIEARPGASIPSNRGT